MGSFALARWDNKQAYTLVDALIIEALERRFDRAFGITRFEDQWDRQLSDRIIDHMEISLSSAFKEADTALSREKLLEGVKGRVERMFRF